MCKDRLGTVEVLVPGRREARGAATAGAAVRLERDPAHREGATAIRVVAGEDATVGHVPYAMAAWLAPLMDRGWVELRARVAPGAEGEGGVALTVEVRLTAKGRRILDPPEAPRTPAEELHARVLAHWPPSMPADGEALARLRRRVEQGVEGPVLAETHLLLHVQPEPGAGDPPQEEQTETGDPVEIARFLLRSARVGAGVTSGDLTVFPITLPRREAAPVVLLDEALARGDVEVTEVDQDGEVNALRVINTGSIPVLLPQGLVVVGGKQDRMIAGDVVVGPGGKKTVAVNCVEIGRWEWEEASMKSRRIAPSSVRECAVVADMERVEEVQHRVWDVVEELNCMAPEPSNTSSLDEIFQELTMGEEDDLLERLPADACGFAAVTGDRFLGCDLFGSPELAAPLRERLLEAWAVEAITVDAGEADPPDARTIASLLERAAGSIRPAGTDAGTGTVRLEVRGTGLHGTILLQGRNLLHASLFPA